MPEASKSTRGKSKSVLSYAPKDRIDHSVFGLGTIVTINAYHTTIAFDEAGTRKFVTSMVKLTSSDTPAPARRVTKKKKAKAKAKTKVTKKATTKATKKATTKTTSKSKAASKAKASTKTKK